MPISLLATELYFPPARDNLAPRTRLMDRPSTGLRRPLTLLFVPVGYGNGGRVLQQQVPANW